MKRYLKLITALVIISTKRYLENRVNAVAGILSSLGYFLITILFISVIFSKTTSSIEGWSRPQTFLLLGIYQTCTSLFSLLCLRGINFIPRYVRDGELDILLTKPLNSQFYLTFRFTRVWEVFSLTAGLSLIYYSLNQINSRILVSNLLALILGLLIGMVILYGIFFSVATLSIWFHNFSSLASVVEILSTPLAYPFDILGKKLSFILTFVVPLGFVITIPVKLFLNKLPIFFIGYGFAFAVVIFIFCVWFWHFSLKHYTSASS